MVATRRYEVWRLTLKDKAGGPRLVMILQSEKIDHLTTVVTAPVVRTREDIAIPSLTPQISMNGAIFSVLIPFIAAIDRKFLQAIVYSGDAHSYEIDRAIDRLFLGI